jgi:TolA-binding protein
MKKIGVMLLLALLWGCAAKTDEQLYSDAVEAQKASDQDEAIETYEELLAKYPQSPRVPEALYAMGTIYQDHKKLFPEAIATYQKLVDAYPDHGTSPNALFLIGFINNNELKNTEAARTAYEAFLKKYPTSSLVSSAEFELQHLGKNPAQILEEQTTPRAEGRKKK